MTKDSAKINLLILTQKVDINDSILGFFHGWIEEFAKHCGKLTVICLEKGEYNLPSNVRVLSLGKERGVKGLKAKALYVVNFYRYIWKYRKDYDSVFVHMNPEYVILGGIPWRLMRKKVALWYAHKQVHWKLRLTEKIAHIVFTSTKSGFRTRSKKLKIVGQGIDVSKFRARNGEFRARNEELKIVSVGRISPIKDYETLIKAVKALVGCKQPVEAEIAGGPATDEDKKYLEKLKREVAALGLSNVIKFAGPKINDEVVDFLKNADLFVSTSNTGSLDKAILEAMAVGLPVISCNDSFKEITEPFKDILHFGFKDFNDLAKKIVKCKNMEDKKKDELAGYLRNIVKSDHSLSALIVKIVNNF